MNYKDKNGKPVKAGDILFYNEPIPYAESIHKVIEINGELHGVTVIGNYFREYCVTDDTPLPLKYYTSELYGDNSGIMGDAELIGNVIDNPEMLTVEFANKYHPLPNPLTRHSLKT